MNFRFLYVNLTYWTRDKVPNIFGYIFMKNNLIFYSKCTIIICALNRYKRLSITWTNADQHQWRHMMSLSHNQLSTTSISKPVRTRWFSVSFVSSNVTCVQYKSFTPNRECYVVLDRIISVFHVCSCFYFYLQHKANFPHHRKYHSPNWVWRFSNSHMFT